MSLPIADILKKQFAATEAVEVEEVQSLWSGYGTISRWKLKDSEINTVIVKKISLPKEFNHPKGWNTDRSHQRKLKSYSVEMKWYEHYAKRCDYDCSVPTSYFTMHKGEEQLIVLEDMDALGYPLRQSKLKPETAKVCLSWLAHFHATFLGVSPKQLWETGTYWNLSSRPDEWQAMENGWLKEQAAQLDQLLSNAQFQTLVHGDAKVANFCFSKNLKQVAAVDFQYLGGGCGIKDVAYFLGSCLTAEECEQYETELLNHYFKFLSQAIDGKQTDVDKVALEKEWRKLYAIAWTDFSRFLKGWMPEHEKLNAYSDKMEQKAKKILKTISF
jgi:hypothetical protein